MRSGLLITKGRESRLPFIDSQDVVRMEITLGVVIPTFNRRANLYLSLRSLAAQNCHSFLVVVADDGSTDGTQTLVQKLQKTRIWKGRLDYIWCGSNRGICPGRARNLGVTRLPTDLELYLFVDSDIIIEAKAIQRVINIYNKWNSVLIQGLVNWLRPIPIRKLVEKWKTGGFGTLEDMVPVTGLGRIEGTYIGPDLRLSLSPNPFIYNEERPRRIRAEWTLSSFLACPSAIYKSIGGFDESMNMYGYDDIEFGANANAAKVKCVFSSKLRAVHIWHPKPDPYQRAIEEQWNLDYVLRKHGHNTVLANNIEWTYWWHYHRQRGGTLVRVGNSLWAINAEKSYRILLPTAEWILRLGHSGQSIINAEEQTIRSIPEISAEWIYFSDKAQNETRTTRDK